MFEIEIKTDKKSYRETATISQYERDQRGMSYLPFQFYSNCLGIGEYIISVIFDKKNFSREGENIIECHLYKDNELVDSKHFKELPYPVSNFREMKVSYYYYYRGYKS